jgi:hypothetical protein
MRDTPRRLSPIAVLLSLGVVAALLLFGLDGRHNSETDGVAISILVATTVWTTFCFGIARKIDLRTRRIVSALLVVKVIAGLLFFYFVYAPLSDISSSDQLAFGNYQADSRAIDLAARVFQRERENGGLFEALWGDYYRAINNSGVGVAYGVLYDAFGPYCTATIPWHAFAMGIAALMLVELGLVLEADLVGARRSAIVMLLMPTFFIGAPLYRDQFMLMLILLIVLSVVTAMKGSWQGWIVAIIATLALQPLRTAYIIMPLIAYAAWMGHRLTATELKFRDNVAMLAGFLASLASIIAIATVMSTNSEVGQNLLTRLSEGENRDAATVRVGGGYAGAFVFMLLTPMPWYQKVNPVTLSLQVFDYPQTLLFLTTLAALLFRTSESIRTRPTAVALFAGGLIFASAVVAPDLAQRYGQIALPLLLLGVMPSLVKNWLKCGVVAAAVIALAHIALEITR